VKTEVAILLLGVGDAIVLVLRSRSGTIKLLQSLAGLWMLTVVTLAAELLGTGLGLIFMIISSITILLGPQGGLAQSSAQVIGNLFGGQQQKGATAK
jgi:hypothetical protein